MPHNLNGSNIFLEPAPLLAQLAPLRKVGQRLLLTNGCFDLLHPGHVDLLERAKKLGDILVVGLNTDASIRRLGKGEDRPFNPIAARAFVLAHLRCVDFVTSFDDDTPEKLIQTIQPDILVKGGDWPLERIVGAQFVLEHGGKVFSLPLLPGYSTTGLALRIRQGSNKTNAL